LGSADSTVEKPGTSLGHKLLYYVPNRLLDAADLLRLRLRAGPGWAVNVRATEPLSVFIGSYRSCYVGLPGPRMSRSSRVPWGREAYKGIQFSVADATDEGDAEPAYTQTEWAVGGHLGVVGVDAGTDPYEWYDLLAGFLMIDPRGDDR
jgi:hypothetical protein